LNHHSETSEETDPTDLETFDKFNPPDFDDPILRGLGGLGGVEAEADRGQPQNLADLILEKITQQEAAEAQNGPQGIPVEEEAMEIPPKVVEVYTRYILLQPIHILFSDQMLLQNWPSPFTLQIRKAPKGLQNYPYTSVRHAAGCSPTHLPRRMDTKRHLRGHTHFHLLKLPHIAVLLD
jgi:hypothetical protein